MHVDTPLISTIIGGIVLAFIFGTIAQRLRLPPLVGYLMAGVVAGPFTPGFVADQSLAPQLAELGVILLMFGVGLHFSMKELLAVKAIAIPGAIGQIALATLMGMGLAWLLGWDASAFPGKDGYWWVPIVAPLIGGVVGGGAHHLLIRPFLPRTLKTPLEPAE